MNLDHKVDTSTQADIQSHFAICDKDFIANLSQKVNLEEYSKKIFDNAVRLETWDNNTLVGLAAIYINKGDNFAFLTNISVGEAYTGKKIGSELLSRCINFVTGHKVAKIRLEVEKQNMPAVKLYEKYNFKTVEVNETTQFMERPTVRGMSQ